MSSKILNIRYTGINNSTLVANKKDGTQFDPEVMSSTVSPEWLTNKARPHNHTEAVSQLRERRPESVNGSSKNLKRIFQKPVDVIQSPINRWPMDSSEPPPFPPPWPSSSERRAMCAESSHRPPEAPLGPLAAQWQSDLCDWYRRLQSHFQFDPSDLASNVRKSADRWEQRLQYLKQSDKPKFDNIMECIKFGHTGAVRHGIGV